MTETYLDRIAAGDQQAVGACIDRYSNLVWSIAVRMSPSRTEAEDAVQEIFIDLWKSAPRFDSQKASEKAFVAMVARRRLIDRMRLADRRPQMQSLTAEIPHPPDSSSSRAETLAEAGLASRALRELRPEQRRILLASVLYGMSHSEISQASQLPIGTVKSHITRGMRAVRDRLAEPGSAGAGAAS